MTPVTQTRLYDPSPDVPPGNCFAACVATILDLTLAEVPDLMEFWTPKSSDTTVWRNYWKRYHEWLKSRGLAYIEVSDVSMQAAEMEGVPCIVSGKSPREATGLQHAVVGTWERIEDGVIAPKILHDPHPSRAGLVKGDWTYGYFLSRFSL